MSNDRGVGHGEDRDAHEPGREGAQAGTSRLKKLKSKGTRLETPSPCGFMSLHGFYHAFDHAFLDAVRLRRLVDRSCSSAC